LISQTEIRDLQKLGFL